MGIEHVVFGVIVVTVFGMAITHMIRSKSIKA